MCISVTEHLHSGWLEESPKKGLIVLVKVQSFMFFKFFLVSHIGSNGFFIHAIGLTQ
jgi:hypothetical protein